MTDKQIIIDGINVSECVQFIRETENCCALGGNCKGWNCYYKQTKFKEQEYERLKRDYLKQNEWLKEQRKQLDQLEAENKELKTSLANDECFVKGSKKCVKAFCLDEELREQLEQEKTLKEMYFTYYKAKHEDIKGEFFKLRDENDTYKKMFEDEDVRLALIEVRTGERKLWFNKAEKFKRVLAEIKDFVENEMVPNDDTHIILQLISEVEDDRQD